MADTAQADQKCVLGASPEQRRAFESYIDALSNGRYEEAINFYNDDIVLERPALAPDSVVDSVKFVGTQEVVGYYRQLFTKFSEVITINSVIADDNGICAHLTSTFTPLGDASDFEPMPLKPDETLTVSVYVIYTLRDGKISRISLALS